MTGSEPEDQKPSGGRRRFIVVLLPLLAFAGFALVAAKMLYEQTIHDQDISDIPSTLIGAKAPSLNLPPLEGSGRAPLTDNAIRGKLTLVNIFASWCIPCRSEHPVLMELSKDSRLQLVAINYKDKAENAVRFLNDLGNPYQAIGVDATGRASIDWGVYGVPESYLVAPDGTVLYKHIGPFDDKSAKGELLPVIEKVLQTSP